MAIRRYIPVWLHWWWALILGSALVTALTFTIVSRHPPVYRTTATLFINQVSTTGSVSYQDALLNQSLVFTYSQMLVKPVVLDEVARRLSLPYSSTDLAGMISIRPVASTQLIDITVSGSNPTQARDIANTVALVFIAQEQPYLPTAQMTSAIRLDQPALLPTSQSGLGPKAYAAGAGVAVLVVLLGVIALIEDLRPTVRTPEDVEESTSLGVLGSVSHIPLPTNPSISWQQLHRASETYRLIRANLSFACNGDTVTTLLVTSAVPDEGKSTTASNLAIVLAQAGKRVILVDADLRAPDVHRIFNLSNDRGFADLLTSDDDDIHRYLQPSRTEGLRILTSGSPPENPAELLESTRVVGVLELLKAEADVVIFDSAPILGLADSVVLANRVDGTILVVNAERTPAEAIQEASDLLRRSDTRLLGAILNNTRNSAKRYYRYQARENHHHVTSLS